MSKIDLQYYNAGDEKLPDVVSDLRELTMALENLPLELVLAVAYNISADFELDPQEINNFVEKEYQKKPGENQNSYLAYKDHTIFKKAIFHDDLRNKYREMLCEKYPKLKEFLETYPVEEFREMVANNVIKLNRVDSESDEDKFEKDIQNSFL